jgi:hypothetical protein
VALATTSSARLDKSFGKGGVVEVGQAFAAGKGLEPSINQFATTGGGAAYAVGNVYPCLPKKCRTGGFLVRFGPNGAKDHGFGDRGVVFLHGQDEYPQVTADGPRPIVLEDGKDDVVLRRFDADGRPDRSFGAGGVAKVPAKVGEGNVDLLSLPGGRLLVYVSHGIRNKKAGYGAVASQVRLFELRADGRKDRDFGDSGALVFKIPRRGEVETLATAADGSVILGGVGWEETPRRAWLWRVEPSGKVDRRFDRAAAHSLARLGTLGEFPSLEAILPRADGTIELVGTIHAHLGFVLRLRGDGKLATGFGHRGLAQLPAEVAAATGGIGGAVFVVGEGKGSYESVYPYKAYRVLGNGQLDPAYRGGHGVKVPLPGEGVDVESERGGRALVTSIGYYECRADCPSEPGMALFRE